MRPLALTALLWLAACTDEFAEAQKANTIEAWSAYLDKDPSSMNAVRAKSELEKLMMADAKAAGTVEKWDAYIARFGDLPSADVARDAREALLLEAATKVGDEAAWKHFLELCPEASTTRKNIAEAALKALAYGMTVGEITVAQVNLAEDPKGPLDGWGFKASVTNGGDQVVESMIYRLDLLDAAGNPLSGKTWPLVAPYKEWPTPVPDAWMVPMQPGEVRTFDYTTGDLPAGWAQKARLVPLKIRFAPAATPAP